jgi:hypothetical protein
MIITIISNDNTSRVLSYDNTSPFVEQCKKDHTHLLKLVQTIDSNYKTFTDRTVSGGAVEVKRLKVAEKLPMKMKVKNSAQTSKELFDAIIKHDLGKYGSIKIKSRFGTIIPI